MVLRLASWGHGEAFWATLVAKHLKLVNQISNLFVILGKQVSHGRLKDVFLLQSLAQFDRISHCTMLCVRSPESCVSLLYSGCVAQCRLTLLAGTFAFFGMLLFRRI
jgi:hypothetical protein